MLNLTPLVPDKTDGTVHIVLNDFGDLGRALRYDAPQSGHSSLHRTCPLLGVKPISR